MTNRIRYGGLLFALVAMVGILVWRATAPMIGVGGDASKPPNQLTAPPPKGVFLIVVDTLRPDRLSCYGYDQHNTPNIDRLATRGVRFTRAQSVASWTLPSMGSMMTSRYPTQLGLVEHPAGEEHTLAWRAKRLQQNYRLGPEPTTLAERMQAIGYKTAAFVDQPALNLGGCFVRGFDDWYYPVDKGVVGHLDRASNGMKQKWDFIPFADRNDWALIESFEQWLPGATETGSIFAWIHLLTPHRPYLPSEKYLPPRAEGDTNKLSYSDRYDAEVRMVDDMIGAITHAINKHVGANESLIILTSDHGEAFGEHGMTEHGHTLHREVVHVPLLMVSNSLSAGSTIDGYVRTIDIMPTILAMADTESPTPSGMMGTSLWSIMRERQDPFPVYMEAMLYGSTERAIVEDGFKLMYDQQDDRYALYAVLTDPDELTDVSTQYPDRRTNLKQRLTSLHAQFKSDYDTRGAVKKIVDPTDAEREQQETLEALRSLGYVGDDE